MDDAGFVRGFERLGNLPRNRDGLVERHRPLRNAVGERLALDQLEDQGGNGGRFLQAVDGADVGVVQRRQHLRFALEPGEPVRVGGQRVGQDLERDIALQLAIAGAVNFSHTPRSQGRANFVRAEVGAREKRHG